MKSYFCDVVVVGAGPAGLAAAVAAKQAGADEVVLIERDIHTGGILQQCIHPGFGLKYFNEELTGPEYAERFSLLAAKKGVQILLDTTALEIRDHLLVCASSAGLIHISYKALVLAMGCRERTRANLEIPGSRPSGIYTAGTAQKLINIYGDRIGKEIVILGSGDIGMIMARRLTLEGAHVKAVVEIMPFLAGLMRNKIQCLDDFGIPLMLSHSIVDINGIDRLESVTVAPVEGLSKKPDLSGREIIPCDTLLLSVGLIPENELSKTGNVPISSATKGALVNQFRQTEVPSVFACGNVLHVNDLVDNVSIESEVAGKCAALFAQNMLPSAKEINVLPSNGVTYVCPQKIVPNGSEDVTLYFRTALPGKKTTLTAKEGGRVVSQRIIPRSSPGTMETLVIPAETIMNLKNDIFVSADHKEAIA